MYADTNVDEKKTYYYCLRLIGRMQKEPGEEEEERDAKGNLVKVIKYMAPKAMTQQTFPPRQATQNACSRPP